MFLQALPQLRAERQLGAIEASVFPHMKPEDAKRVAERHRRAATPSEDRPKSVNPLLDAFREAGLQIVHE